MTAESFKEKYGCEPPRLTAEELKKDYESKTSFGSQMSENYTHDVIDFYNSGGYSRPVFEPEKKKKAPSNKAAKDFIDFVSIIMSNTSRRAAYATYGPDNVRRLEEKFKLAYAEAFPGLNIPTLFTHG